MIGPYTSNAGPDVLILYIGELSVGDAFKTAHYEQKLVTWALRFVGFVLLFFSATCSYDMLQLVAAKLPLLTRIVPNPSSPMSGNILLSLSATLVIAAVSWIVFRPWIGIGMMCAAASPFLIWHRQLVDQNDYRINHID